LRFREALAAVCRTHDIVFLCNPFYVYACLADLCQNDWDAREQADCFFVLDQKMGLLAAAIAEKGDVSSLRLRYYEVYEEASQAVFLEIIDTLGEVVSQEGNYYYAKTPIAPKEDKKKRVPTPFVTEPSLSEGNLTAPTSAPSISTNRQNAVATPTTSVSPTVGKKSASTSKQANTQSNGGRETPFSEGDCIFHDGPCNGHYLCISGMYDCPRMEGKAVDIHDIRWTAILRWLSETL